MGTPTKRRKLNNDTKSSGSRNLDFFFAKQKKDEQELSSPPDGSPSQNTPDGAGCELTDEQLARKLQEEWNREPIDTQGVAGHLLVETNEQVFGDPASADTTPGLAIEKAQSDGIFDQPAVKSLKSDTNKNTLSLQWAGTAEDTISSNIPFDESPLTFEPSRHVSDLQTHWTAEGGDASYALLTRCFILINSTQSRIKIVDALVNLLRVIIEGDPDSLLPTVSLNHS